MALEVETHYLREWQILAVRFYEDGQPRNYFFRVLQVEPVPYQYSFGAIAAAASSGTIRPQDTQNRYFLRPDQETLVNHIFTGVTPTRAELYLAYPSDKDRNSLIGSRTVGSGNGVYADGRRSPYHDPDPVTELIVPYGIDPSFNAYTPVAATVKAYFHAKQYRVTNPITQAVRELAEPLKQITEDERRRARVIAVYGKTPTDVPDWLKGKYIA